MGEALRAAAARPPAVIVGSSLGALVALAVARRGAGAPLVLIAPALGFGARWTEKLPAQETIPVFHHGADRELQIHRRFFEQMGTLDVDQEPPVSRVTIVMGENDESVPYELVREVWRSWEATGRLAKDSRFVPVAGGDHGLVDHVGVIANEIRVAIGRR